MAKRKKQTGSRSTNRQSGYRNNAFRKRVPIPSEVYEHVKQHMWSLTLDELKNELGVSKRVARALRDGVPITISDNYLSILKSIVGLDRRYGFRARIKWASEESRDRKLYVELNRYLAKMIAEMPESIVKVTRGGWRTRHLNYLRPLSPWCNQMLVLQLITDLKRWYTDVHERYPEFDKALFEGTGLFKDKPAGRTETGSNDQAAIPVQRPRRRSSSSRKSSFAMKKSALAMAISMLRQYPPIPAPHTKHI